MQCCKRLVLIGIFLSITEAKESAKGNTYLVSERFHLELLIVPDLLTSNCLMMHLTGKRNIEEWS